MSSPVPRNRSPTRASTWQSAGSPPTADDIALAVHEMARVARDRVVVQDNLFQSEAVEEAERLHDPSHVRCYSEDEWRSFFAAAQA